MSSWIRHALSALCSVLFVAGLGAQTVTPPVLSGIIGGGTVELGQRVSMMVVYFSLGGEQTYQWRKNGNDITGATESTFVIAEATGGDAGTYTVAVSNVAGTSVASTNLVVKTLGAPVVLSSPQSRTGAVGQSTTFSFTAIGSYPRTYQWRKEGVDIAGATEATYTIATLALGDAGVYSVVVTNSVGSSTSAGASLSVNAATPPVIMASYPADATATQGQELALGIALSGGSTPFTYQWMKNGVAITNAGVGATNSTLFFSAITLADAGRYSVRVTNIAGSAVSREANVTVNPAVPVTFNSQPQSRTVVVGDAVSFNVSVNGSSPLTYQWRRNGAPITGATFSSYSITAAAQADAGDYTVVVTNGAGSVTSAAAVLTVNLPVAPAITQQPVAQTIDFNASLSLSVQVTGSPPLRYAWSKDGVPLAFGTASSYSFNNATVAQNGVYTVTVTNAGGSVTSASAQVTVRAPVLARIVTQPKAAEVAAGLSASFSVSVNSDGAGQLSYQWRRNDVAIAGATGSTLSLNAVKAADAGDYTVVISGPAGTVTSAAAKLMVLPPAAPRSSVTIGAGISFVTLGQSVSFGSYYSIEGTPPLAYQWARNGVAIPGATGTSFSLPALQSSDLADYTLTVSNAGGVLTFLPNRLRLATGSPTPWLDAAQQGDMVYFLATQPARIERYDLAAERWLTPTYLSETRVPTAFAPAAEGIYIAYGRTLVRRSTDLATETALINTARDITHLFVFDNYLYYNQPDGSSNSPPYGTLHRSTLQAGPVALLVASYGYRQVAMASSLRKGFGRTNAGSSAELTTFTLAADGAVASRDNPFRPEMPTASRTFVFPGDQLVAEDSGIVYRTSDLAYVGSLGENLTDLAFLGDGTPVVLRGTTLTKLRADNFQETGRVVIPDPGIRMFTRGTNIFVFNTPAAFGGTYMVFKVSAAALTPAPAPTMGTLPARYSTDDAFLGADKVVHVFSRTLQGLVRWSPTTRSFLAPIPLRAAPLQAFHQPGNNRAIFTYWDGSVTELPLNAGTNQERILGTVGQSARGLVDLGDTVMLHLGYASGADFRLSLGPNGELRQLAAASIFSTTPLAWQSTLRRLYENGSYDNSIQYETISTAGTQATLGPSSAAITSPLRFNPEGTLMVGGNGGVLNADLGTVGALANNILDAAWLGNGLATIRSVSGATEVQHWSRLTYLQTASVSVVGVPVRLLRLSATQVVVVTNVLGVPSFTVLNDDLSFATTPVPVVTFAQQPASQAPNASGAASFSVTPQGTSGAVTYAWARNGESIAGANGSTLSLNNVQPANAGLYTATASDAVNGATTDPAILGVSSSAKVIGSASEVGPNIVHQNGITYDQILLQGTAAAVTADADQVLRVSFVDATGDIVQVELSGAGTLSLVLENPTGPAAAANYNQPGVSYMKGHAGIVVTGANETSNLTVFSVGRMTAVNAALFRSDVTYDGMADLAFIAIQSANGKFGGLRAANATFFGTRGLTGLYAPNVQFAGPVYLGDVNAFDNAVPTIVVGAAADARIAGGDLFQTNGKAVNVAGLSKLNFVTGTDSHGTVFSAQTNKARLENRGVDVTNAVVVNPGP